MKLFFEVSVLVLCPVQPIMDCCVCRRPCALTLWIKTDQLMIWQRPSSPSPPSPPRRLGSDRPACTRWNVRTRRGSFHARAPAGATARPLGGNADLSGTPVAPSWKQTWSRGSRACRLRPVGGFPAASKRCLHRRAAPEQPALAAAVRWYTTPMRKSAILTVLFTHTPTHRAPRTKADICPQVPGSAETASANRSLRFWAGAGSKERARRREKSRLLWRRSWWTAVLSWEGELRHLTPALS